VATLAQLRSRVQYQLRDLEKTEHDPSLINAVINEGLREMARKTLLLDESTDSLTYSSPGFTLPTDFIKVRDLQWKTSNDLYSSLDSVSIDFVYKKRNDYAEVESTDADVLIPRMYSIDQGKIIIDSTTETSPILYYYKYDSALNSDSNSPSFNSEYHKFLIDYAVWQLVGDNNRKYEWLNGLRAMLGTKPQSRNKRMQYRRI